MATITKAAMAQNSSSYGAIPTPRTYPEAASQTFVLGELVFMSNGYLTEIAGNTPASIVGLAGQDAHNNAVAGAKEASVHLANEGTLFEGNVLGASLADQVSTAAYRGRVMGIQRDTTNNITFLDASVTGGANARVFVHDFAKGSAVGDTNARVIYEFLPAFVPFRSTS